MLKFFVRLEEIRYWQQLKGALLFGTILLLLEYELSWKSILIWTGLMLVMVAIDLTKNKTKKSKCIYWDEDSENWIDNDSNTYHCHNFKLEK